MNTALPEKHRIAFSAGRPVIRYRIDIRRPTDTDRRCVRPATLVDPRPGGRAGPGGGVRTPEPPGHRRHAAVDLRATTPSHLAGEPREVLLHSRFRISPGSSPVTGRPAVPGERVDRTDSGRVPTVPSSRSVHRLVPVRHGRISDRRKGAPRIGGRRRNGPDSEWRNLLGMSGWTIHRQHSRTHPVRRHGQLSSFDGPQLGSVGYTCPDHADGCCSPH